MISIAVAGTGVAVVGACGLAIKKIYDRSVPKNNIEEAIKGAKEAIFLKDEFENIFKELDVTTVNKKGETEWPYVDRKLIGPYYNIYILHTPTKLYLEHIEKCKEDIQKKLNTQVYINRDEETAQIFICEKIKHK